MIEKTPPDVLYELAIRSFTGSRDLPKDDDRAMQLFQMALDRAVMLGDQRHIDIAEYYIAITMKDQILEQAKKEGGRIDA